MQSETLIGAALVSPALLWGGVALMSAPILIHLLSRRRFRRIAWAATSFLLQANRQNRRRMRMEHLILLSLRCLAMALLGLLLARPLLRSGAVAEMLGGVQRTERIFVLDDSYSMGASSGAGSVFDDARQTLLNSVRTVHRRSPDDPVTVVLTSRPTTPLITGVYLDESRLNELQNLVEAVQVSESPDVHSVFDELARSLWQANQATDAAIYIISDFQRKDWFPSSATESPAASPLGPFRGRDEEAGALGLIFQEVRATERNNLSITELTLLQRRFVADAPGRLEARITNHGNQMADPVRLQVYLDGAALAEQLRVRVGPGESVTVPIELYFSTVGSHVVEVELAPDILLTDNVRQVSVDVVEAVHVLILNGEPALETARDEAGLFAAALRPQGPVDSGNDVRVVDEIDFSEMELAAFDVVVLANVYGLDEEARNRLESFAQAGGGVIFFLGDQVSAEVYNTTLYRDGKGIFPLLLGEPYQAADDRSMPTLRVREEFHPLTRLFVGENNPLLSRLHFRQYFETEDVVANPDEVVPGQVSTDANGEASVEAKSRAKVLLSFDDESGTAALVESLFGRGRILVFTSSCDQEWNDWAQNPSYLVTALEMVQYAARESPGPYQVAVGEAIRFSLDPARFEPSVILRPPGAGPAASATIQAEVDPSGEKLHVDWPHTDHSGTYGFELTDRAGHKHQRFVSVNRDPAEGNLATCSQAELGRLGSMVADEVTFGVSNTVQAATLNGRRELWPTLVILLAAVLLTEQGLAWWFGTRS